MFNANVKIINASLNFQINVPTQKGQFYRNLYINQIFQTNLKRFSNERSDTALILGSLNSSLKCFLFAFLSFYTKHMFMLSNCFKSHLIRHSGTRCAFKETQRVLRHLRHTESTRALGHSESTQRALRGHSGTWRPIGHSEGTWALDHLKT